MFCPKCGTQNPENGKFCRKCGTDLGNISQALSGSTPQGSANYYVDRKGRFKSKDPDEIWANGIKAALTGVGFLIVAIALLATGVAGGHAWWWAMLFPAFGSLSSGISQMARAKRMMKQAGAMAANNFQQNQLPPNQYGANLPPSQTEYVSPIADSRYKTGDLVPPSVVEATTRHLELNSEGQPVNQSKK